MNKKGFELSINFIVILILSIVIFGFGIKFFYELMNQANNLNDETWKQINSQLEDILCDSSERICIGTTTREIRPNKLGVFTIGILNTDDTTSSSDFRIDVKESDTGEVTPIGEEFWMLQNDVTIRSNEQKKVGIGVRVPGGTPKGTYVLNVYVCKNVAYCDEVSHDDPGIGYGATQKLYVVVT